MPIVRLRQVFVAVFFTLFTVTALAQTTETNTYDYPYQDYLLENVNSLRADLGLPPFTYDARLEEAAFEQADWMVRNWSYAHVHGGSTPTTRAEAAGYVDVEWCCSENTFLSPTRTPEAALNFWIRSKAHYNQLTSTEFDQIGIGFDHGAERTGQVIVFGTRGNPSEDAPVDAAETEVELAAANPEPEAVPASANDATHIVQRGENLYRIGLRYGVSANDLRAANGINGSTIYVGQRLSIPGRSVTSAAPAGPSPAPVRIESVPVANPDLNSVYGVGCTGPGGDENRLVQLSSGAPTCRLMVENGFFHVSHAQIGHSEVIDAGVIHAVDLFGVTEPVEICMDGRGPVLFLSETDAPRVPRQLSTSARAGFTCVSVANGGIIALVNVTDDRVGIGGSGPAYIPANPVEFVELRQTGWGGTEAGSQQHIVTYGETLFSIARRYGTSADRIIERNGLVSTVIVPGQQLRIP
jgi:LysM repeat protein